MSVLEGHICPTSLTSPKLLILKNVLSCHPAVFSCPHVLTFRKTKFSSSYTTPSSQLRRGVAITLSSRDKIQFRARRRISDPASSSSSFRSSSRHPRPSLCHSESFLFSFLPVTWSVMGCYTLHHATAVWTQTLTALTPRPSVPSLVSTLPRIHRGKFPIFSSLPSSLELLPYTSNLQGCKYGTYMRMFFSVNQFLCFQNTGEALTRMEAGESNPTPVVLILLSAYLVN